MCNNQSPISAFIAGGGGGGGGSVNTGVLQTLGGGAIGASLVQITDQSSNVSPLYLGNTKASILATATNGFLWQSAFGGSYTALYPSSISTPSNSNYAMLLDGSGTTYLNGSTNMYLGVGNNQQMGIDGSKIYMTPNTAIGGTYSPTARVDVKGDGSNPIQNWRNGAGVVKAYMNNDGAYNGWGWYDNVGYTSFLVNATLGLYDGNLITGITGSAGFRVGNGSTHTKNAYWSVKNTGTGNVQGWRKVDDTESAYIDSDGAYTSNGYFSLWSKYRIKVGVSGSETILLSNGSGVISLLDRFETDFNRLQFGGATSSYPALKRSTTELQARLADDSGFAPFASADISVTGNIIRPSRGRISWYSGDGNMTITNSGETDFGRLNFGGITSSFPALKRNGGSLDVVYADGTSGYASFGCGEGTKLGISVIKGGTNTPYIGFFGVDEIAQPTTAIAEATFASGGAGTNVKTDDTFGGYTLQQIAQALLDIGILS